MKNAFYLLLPLLLFVASCEDDDDPVSTEAELSIAFRGEFGEDDLAIQSATYDYPTGEQLKVLLFQYYLSDLELLPSDGGDAVRLSDIELIRWMSATEGPVASKTYTVPTGDYQGIRFGLGVKPTLNAQDPNNFAADGTLNENEFWNATARYVFAKIEANADLEGDGTFDTPLTYHMGSDALYTTVTFAQNFSLDGSNDPQLTIISDVLAALSDGNNTFDISDADQQRVHGGNQAIASDIWNRLANQFELEVR